MNSTTLKCNIFYQLTYNFTFTNTYTDANNEERCIVMGIQLLPTSYVCENVELENSNKLQQ